MDMFTARAEEWRSAMTRGQEVASVPAVGGSCGGCEFDQPCSTCGVARDDKDHLLLEWARLMSVGRGLSQFWQTAIASDLYFNSPTPPNSDSILTRSVQATATIVAMDSASGARYALGVGPLDGGVPQPPKSPPPPPGPSPTHPPTTTPGAGAEDGPTKPLIPVTPPAGGNDVTRYKRRDCCCIADGIEIEYLPNYPDNKCPELYGDASIRVTMKWKAKREPGRPCVVEWWEWSPSENIRTDDNDPPRKYWERKTWSEMANRAFPGLGLFPAAVRLVGSANADIRKKCPEVPSGMTATAGSGETMFVDKACLPPGFMFFIYIRQISGCEGGPTKEASVYVVRGKDGGAPRVVPPKTNHVNGWPPIDPEHPTPYDIPGQDDPELAVPPPYWSKTDSKPDGWEPAQSPFDSRVPKKKGR